MPSWLPSALVIKEKNALCLSQSAFSNIAPQVIKEYGSNFGKVSFNVDSKINSSMCLLLQVLLLEKG